MSAHVGSYGGIELVGWLFLMKLGLGRLRGSPALSVPRGCVSSLRNFFSQQVWICLVIGKLPCESQILFAQLWMYPFKVSQAAGGRLDTWPPEVSRYF